VWWLGAETVSARTREVDARFAASWPQRLKNGDARPSTEKVEAMSRIVRTLICRFGMAGLGILLAASSASARVPAFPSVVVTSAAHSGRVPYMGVDTWYPFGASINEQRIVSFANAVVSSGLRAAGYRIVWLDGGWWDGSRDANGDVVVNPANWPHGMAWLAAYLHSNGLRAGIYTDAGASGCGGPGAGSFDHYQQDVNTFAAWGFDAIKVDYCGGHLLQLDPRTAYGAFARAIASDQPHRPMILNLCNPVEPGHYGNVAVDYASSAFDSWSFAPAIATSWRTSYDVGWPGDVPFAHVLHNLDADAAHPQAAGAGHFNDPDYLVPQAGMNRTEARTQFTMWAMLAAPLMISADPSVLAPQTLRMLEQPEAIAIDQDRLGAQGKRVARGAAEVWVKPLAGGQKAVAFLNRSTVPVRARTSSAAIGLPRAIHLAVRDVWRRQTRLADRTITVTVPAHGAVLLRVGASRNGVR
jgi:alpha-galactosidase